ncbi:hypothetical protein [Raineyella fluvialis]|uniref:Uncharacterized protein n=1 Tax=Raineyella fluvialis TaxID=2662261 RepID=A0A5Q2FGQ0_9ACTN|nr:hypothetical protein [Raineyella fluvialis]QGF23476.1 hypothetical protein Rai3103_07120 [Raineyella fluvialis]
MNTEDVTSYIEQVELASPEESMLLAGEDLPQFEDWTPQGAVVDSNLVTYPEGTRLSVKNAVGAWLLFAQRAASAKVPDKEDTIGWASAYHDTLLRTGWVQRGQTDAWTEENLTGSKVHEQILAVVTVVLGAAPAALAIVTAALKSLQAMDQESPWITLFDRRGKDATAVGFQVANCEASDDGGAALHAVDFRLRAKQTLTQVLFFKLTRNEASLFRRGVVLELTPDVLKDIGPAIQKRVRADMLDSIAAIDLAVPAPN